MAAVSWSSVSWATISWSDISWSDSTTYEDAAEGDANEGDGYTLTQDQLDALLADPDLAPPPDTLPDAIPAGDGTG